MSTTPTAVSGLSLATPAAAEPSEAERAAVKQLAQQFEATLMMQMMSAFRDTMMGDEDAQGLGASAMSDQIHMELAMALSKAGGVGLAESLLAALDKSGPQTSDGASLASMGLSVPPIGTSGATIAGISPQAIVAAATRSTAATAAISPAALTSPVVSGEVGITDTPVLPSAKFVSSHFGWRQDPFTQQARFHHGTDLRVAYGREVRAASGGIVTFAGEKAGYGLTVVVDHGGGLETRYAHLSSTAVQTGMQVQAGEVLARSGNSGRSTGAHLHFEVRQDGQAVDPRQFDQRLGPVVDLE
ncbi:MAG: peptidoglycan DD-metalloendopeptidase family protein [Acidobacteria bacterium]|nr:peptidoglycan DD-metalloendopeptidase family protein [Acidobacteriota bacterium]